MSVYWQKGLFYSTIFAHDWPLLATDTIQFCTHKENARFSGGDDALRISSFAAPENLIRKPMTALPL
ncbi:hypothetical protein RA27_22430 [Ruegeria sp. ANG-R]|nr:hypothetical protein RA27_22430 [Ruegeria sp. ANG-R]